MRIPIDNAREGWSKLGNYIRGDDIGLGRRYFNCCLRSENDLRKHSQHCSLAHGEKGNQTLLPVHASSPRLEKVLSN